MRAGRRGVTGSETLTAMKEKGRRDLRRVALFSRHEVPTSRAQPGRTGGTTRGSFELANALAMPVRTPAKTHITTTLVPILTRS
jgi:hypothetical protein